ncbi:MAG TPA: HD domain-containing protein, partial [Polyangiaceae bacterium]|nr:HD domain-containing protein [Polyangiaceae bacterium]
DDVKLFGCLSAWRSARDSVLRDFAGRLCERKLFKTYELYAEQAEPNARLEAYAIAKDVARARGYDPEVYVGLDVSSDVPFDDTHEPLTVVFPDNTQRRPADVSFLLGRLRAQKLTRVRLIFVPELREHIVAALMR